MINNIGTIPSLMFKINAVILKQLHDVARFYDVIHILGNDT